MILTQFGTFDCVNMKLYCFALKWPASCKKRRRIIKNLLVSYGDPQLYFVDGYYKVPNFGIVLLKCMANWKIFGLAMLKFKIISKSVYNKAFLLAKITFAFWKFIAPFIRLQVMR